MVEAAAPAGVLGLLPLRPDPAPPGQGAAPVVVGVCREVAAVSCVVVLRLAAAVSAAASACDGVLRAAG